LLQDIRNIDIDWSWIFAPYPYGERYEHFLRIVLSAPTTEELRDWVGWVKSRFRNLILKVIFRHLFLACPRYWLDVNIDRDLS
jgi:poly(A) polymerase